MYLVDEFERSNNCIFIKDCLQITVDGRSSTKFEMTIIEYCQIINLA